VVAYPECEEDESEPGGEALGAPHHPEPAVGRWEIDLEAVGQLGAVAALGLAGAQIADRHACLFVGRTGNSRRLAPVAGGAREVLRPGVVIELRRDTPLEGDG